jgi:hypothetical protein
MITHSSLVDVNNNKQYTGSSLSSIAKLLIKTADEKHREPEPIPTLPPVSKNLSNHTGLSFLLDITDVFNFSDLYWASTIKNLAESGLADELELLDIHKASDSDVQDNLNDL